jgi:hypothetical protein
MIIFTLRPLYLQRNISRYLLDKRLGGARKRFGRFEEKSVTLAGSRIPTVWPVARHYTDRANPAPCTDM